VKDPVNVGRYFEQMISRYIDFFDDEAVICLQVREVLLPPS
jgi:hypothetical protein